MIPALLLIVVFVTSTISGVFGMAGGLMLMGALTLSMSVSAAMVTHGAVQLVSNGWRAVLHRRHVQWRVIAFYVIGSVTAAGALAALSYSPSKPWVYLMLGLTPLMLWLPKLKLDAARAPQAMVCGLLVTGLNVAAGVSGPLLDLFFVRTELSRHQIVATKAATQTFAHVAKIAFYGAPLLAGAQAKGLPPLWFFAGMIPLAMLGAAAGGWVLDRFSDVSFKAWTRWIVTGLGAVYLWTSAQLFLAN